TLKGAISRCASAPGDWTRSFFSRVLDPADTNLFPYTTLFRSTLLDTQTPSSSATSPQYSTSTTISVSYSANDPGANASGLDKVSPEEHTSELHALVELATHRLPETRGSHSYTAAPGDARYYVY